MAMETSIDVPGAGCPSKERPNKDKDKKYILATIRSLDKGNQALVAQYANWADDNTGEVAPIWGMYPRARITRKETRGTMNVKIHKEVWSLGKPTANGIKTARAMKWDMPRYHVQYFDRLRTIFADWDTSIVVSVLNKQAVDAYLDQQMMELAAATMAVDPILAEANAAMGVDIKPPAMSPQTPGEWDLFSRMGGRMASAVATRRAIEHAKALNRYRVNIRPLIADAIIDDGIVIMASKRGNMGMPILSVIPFEMCCLPLTNNNFKDLDTFGYYRWMTPSQIFAEMGEECTPAIRRRINKMATKAAAGYFDYGYGMGLDRTGLPIDPNATEKGVKVFHGMFKDYNIIEVAERKSDGIAKEAHEWGDQELDPSKYDIRRTTYEVVYEGSYICGTNNGPPTESCPDGEVDHSRGMGCIYWGCGMSYSQARMRGSLRGSQLPVAIGVYNMTEMTVESIGARMMAAYYNVVRASLELRALMLKIIPPYIIVEEEFLDGVTSHDGSGQAKRTDIIRTWRQEGVLVVNTRNPEDRDSPLRGIDVGLHIDGGHIPEFERLSNLIDAEMQRFKECGGFNDANDGGTMDDRTAVRNAIEMRKSQSKALKPMTDCMNDVEGRIAEIMYAQISATLAEGKEIEWLGPFMGDATAAMVRLTADNDPMSVGIEMRQVSTEEDRVNFDKLLADSVSTGAITPDEVFVVSDMEDKKEAAALLRIFAQRRADEAHQQQMELVEQQNQGNLAAGQAGQQAALEKAKMELEAKMAEIEAKSAKELERMKVQHQLDIEKIVATADGTTGVKLAEIQASLTTVMRTLESKERIQDGINRTKVETTRMDNDTKVETTGMTTEAQEEIAEKKTADTQKTA
jgi:hypothetical protein